MKKTILPLMTILLIAFVLFGCAAATTVGSTQTVPSPDAPPSVTPAPTAAAVPATLKPTIIPTLEPTLTAEPTRVPVALTDLVVSDLQYLPIQSLVGSATPFGNIVGWLTNKGVSSVESVRIAFFYMDGANKVPLGNTTARFAGAGQRAFLSTTLYNGVPVGAQVEAEVVNFFESFSTGSAVTLEQRGFYTMTFPERSSSFITGELYNPSDQLVNTWGATVLWYDAGNKLVSIALVNMIGNYVAPKQAVPFRIDAAWELSPPDSGVPAADVKRFELIVNTKPVDSASGAITFPFISKPIWIEASQRMIAIAEVTNTTDKWQDVNGYWAAYNDAGQVVGMFKTSMLGSVVAPGETRPIQFILSLPLGLHPDQDWATLVTHTAMFDNFSTATDPRLTLDVTSSEAEPQGTGFVASIQVMNNNAVEISETFVLLSIRSRATGELVMAVDGRVAMGDMSDVIYAKPLAAGQSWPIQVYFELPAGTALDSVDISYSARGK